MVRLLARADLLHPLVKEEKMIEFTSRYGSTYEIRFVKANYACDGSLAVLVEDKEPDFGFWEPYCNLTVNLGGFGLGQSTAYLDANNVPDLCEFVIENGWATIIGEGCSGFCTYPLVEFTEEFLGGICEVME